MGGTYVFDIETNGLLQEGDRVHCVVAIDVSTEEVHRFSPNNLQSAIDLLGSANHLIAHNGIDFDYPFLFQCYSELKLPKLTDTLILSRLVYADMKDTDFRALEKNKTYGLPKKLYGRHSLKSWGYRLGEYKGDFGETTDWSTYSEEMLDYCEQDCWVTLKLYRHLVEHKPAKRAVELEHNFAEIIHRQVQNGWAFDEQKASSLYSKLLAKRQELQDRMSETFPGWWKEMKTPKDYVWKYGCGGMRHKTKKLLREAVKKSWPDLTLKQIDDCIYPGEMKQKHIPFNPASRSHIYRVFAEKYKWKPKLFTPSGEPKVDDDVLNSLDYPEAKVLSEYFLLNKRIGQLAEGNQAWLKLVKNGRIHGSVNTIGAVTGRCTHSHPNVAQTPAIGVPYGKECRELFIASKGKVIVGADASGLELRCLAHYMAYWDKGEYAKVLLEGDIHSVNQEAAGLPTRDNAKTFIYGFLYGAGDEKIGQIVGSGRETGKFLKQKFLKTLPALGKLVGTVKAAAKKGYIIGLDGRKLKVRSEHAALNVLLQSAGAIVMKQSLVNADRVLQSLGGLRYGEDYEFVGNIHDEIQLECKPEDADMVGDMLVRAIRQAGEDFEFKCPLDGEYKIGESWKDTH